MEGLKQCPECQCTDVPMNAEICPFCGHSFGKQSAAAAKPVEAQPKKPIPIPPAEELLRKQDNPPKKTAPVTVTDKGNTASASGGGAAPVVGGGTASAPRSTVPAQKSGAAPGSTEYTTYKNDKTKKKGHGFLKLLIVVIVALVIWFKFIKPPAEEDDDIQTGGAGESYSADFGSTQPEDQMADIGEEDGIFDESEQPLETDYEETPAEEPEDNVQFILPLSDQVYLTREDIEGLSAEELRIARNEIYARHGRIFKDEGLQAYFNSCDWYVGTVPADDFSDSVFNEYERANKDLIVSYEHELGVNGQ